MKNKEGENNLSFVDDNISNTEKLNEPEIKFDEFQYKEGGYGWVVLFFATWYNGFALSMWTNYTLIYPKLIEHYKGIEKNNVTYAAWVGSCSLGISFLFSFISSFLIDFFGCIKIGFVGGLTSTIGLLIASQIIRLKISIVHTFLPYGIIFGIGQSLIMTIPFAILPHYFNKKLGLVNGVLNGGACIILVSYSYLIGYLLEIYSIEIVFYLLACSSFLVAITSFSFKPQLPNPNDNKSMNLKTQLVNSLGLEILKKPKFLIWSLSLFFGVIGNAIPVMTMGHYCEINFPNYKPEILNTVYGISSLLSSIILGKFMDIMKFSKGYNFFFASGAYAFGTWLIRFIKNFYLYCGIIFLYGVFDALFLVSMLPMAYEVSGSSSKLVNQAIGYLNTCISFSVIFGPTISGYYFQKYNNYEIGYNLTIGTLLVAMFIQLLYPDLFFIKFLKKKLFKNKKNNPMVLYRF